MKARLSLVISIAATMLWSCQFDDVLSTPSDGGVIRVTSSLTKAESTGGTNESTTNDNFKKGEIIYVWASKTGGSSTDDYIKAWELTAKDDKGNFADNGNSKTWPYDGSNLDFHALHGNFTEINNKQWSELTDLKHTVSNDQSSDDNRRLSDLLYAAKTGATHGNNVELSFKHLLAKITVKLDLKNSMGITTADFENASVSILGIKPEATFNSSDKEASKSGGTEIDINAGAILQPSDLSSEAHYAGSAIVPLQTINANSSLIQIKLKNRTFIYKASENTTFQKGQEYTYTLTIRGKQITGTLSVSQFDTADDESISFKDYFDYLADLKNRNYLGSSSVPHDLSYDYNGQMNTANCYVITHPGYYKFPLVYGNAIKNGATNSIAYGVDANGSSVSSTFVDHSGTVINNPYITSKYTANSASLVWQDAQNLISNNIALCDDNKYIKFEITKDNIEQGNAVIAVKDGDGTIMWSWHIWVTNKNVYEPYTYGDYNFMPIALGQRETEEGTTCTFYQWGRKDPFPGGILGNNLDNTLDFQSEYHSSINNPGSFIKGKYSNSSDIYGHNWFSNDLKDLWNVGNTYLDKTTYISIKSIYDPCPVGFKVPPPTAFTSIGLNISNWDGTGGNNGIIVPKTGDYWHAFGYRAWSDGVLSALNTGGYYWSCGPRWSNSTDIGYAWGLFFSIFSVQEQCAQTLYRSDAFPIRPISEK